MQYPVNTYLFCLYFQLFDSSFMGLHHKLHMMKLLFEKYNILAHRLRCHLPIKF